MDRSWPSWGLCQVLPQGTSEAGRVSAAWEGLCVLAEAVSGSQREGLGLWMESQVSCPKRLREGSQGCSALVQDLSVGWLTPAVANQKEFPRPEKSLNGGGFQTCGC